MAAANMIMIIMISGSCLCFSFAIPSTLYVPANASLIWTIGNLSFPESMVFSDGSVVRFILFTFGEIGATFGYGLGSGFYCRSLGGGCYFAVVFVEHETAFGPVILTKPPIVVWAANRDNPVKENAMLKLSENEGLVLIDEKGNTMWSAGEYGMSVLGMNITLQGNMMLLDRNNETVWQSFDNPTDTLLIGQTFRKDQHLRASVSPENFSRGQLFACLKGDTLSAYFDGDGYFLYLDFRPINEKQDFQLTHVALTTNNLEFYNDKKNTSSSVSFPGVVVVYLLRIDPDGGIRIYGWKRDTGWQVIYVLLNGYDECEFPLRCGRYGVCASGQCYCPVAFDGTSYFKPINYQLPSLGCQEITPITFPDTSYQHKFVYFGALSYFTYYRLNSADDGLTSNGSRAPGSRVDGLTDESSCKQACLNSTFCKASFFEATDPTDPGYCYLASDVLSIIGSIYTTSGYTSLHMKIRELQSTLVAPNSTPQPQTRRRAASIHFKITLTVIILSIMVFVAALCTTLFKIKKNQELKDMENLTPMGENLNRFSYNELSIATRKFSSMVGKGGFGTVFKGVLTDGTTVAVKQLENTGQGVKEFLAEVNTIGNVHHINLVRLVGYCVDAKHRMLVYEYMTNGSLNNWIFEGINRTLLDWKTRKKILLDVARGLAYLHEECRLKIAHLDVKPHNILLDTNFNAKLSDFGLSKLIQRDESEVETHIRGTLGYIAPEWRNSRITVKADIYSFGIVVLEVISGRKILDYSQPDSQINLLHVLRHKSVEDKLMDVVDRRCLDMHQNKEDVISVMRLGMWCLKKDYSSRPSMSSVVKLLEGNKELDTTMTGNFSSFLSPPLMNSDIQRSVPSP